MSSWTHCRVQGPVHFGEVAFPADPYALILHHGNLRAMVQGGYWD